MRKLHRPNRIWEMMGPAPVVGVVVVLQVFLDGEAEGIMRAQMALILWGRCRPRQPIADCGEPRLSAVERNAHVPRL